MLINYFKLSLRLLIRNPFFTLVNVLGLSIGFAVFFALWEFTSKELKADQHYKDHDRIFRLCTEWNWTDDGKNWGHMTWGYAPALAAPNILKDFSEVESFTRILHLSQFSVHANGHGRTVMISREDAPGAPKRFKENNIVYSDKNLFEFFSIPLLRGNKARALDEANSIVLSKAMAEKYFGTEDAINKSLVLNGTIVLKVTGIFDDLSNNTHVSMDGVISNVTFAQAWDTHQWVGSATYLKMRVTPLADFDDRIQPKFLAYWAETFRTFPNVRTKVFTQRLADVAFNTQGIEHDNFKPKSKWILGVLSIVSLVILGMAWVNYLNLTIARMTRRYKEIGTRKMTGAKPHDFVQQFLVESTIVNLLAVAMAATLIQIGREPAAHLLNIRVSPLNDISNETKLFYSIVIVFGILITGLYPVWLSQKKSPRLLLSKTHTASRNIVPSVLTTIQYAAGIVLIFCGVVIHSQLNYLFDRDMGFENENVFNIEGPVVRSATHDSDIKYLNEMISRKKNVSATTLSSAFVDLRVSIQGEGGNFAHIDGHGVSDNYFSFYKIALAAGRFFKPDESTNSIILSRIAVDRLGYKNPLDAIGTSMYFKTNESEWKMVEIIGVIEDFRLQPFFKNDSNSEGQMGRGYGFVRGQFPYQYISVKLAEEDSGESLAEMNNAFAKVFPGNPFDGKFITDMLHAPYRHETTTRNQVTFFTVVAIFIACIGLLAMISNKVEEKTKEIGIRKALGASVRNIASVLLGTTILQVLVSIFIGIPLAWYLATEYLDRYSERIQITAFYFALPALVLWSILFATVATLLVKAMHSNPADTLRYE